MSTITRIAFLLLLPLSSQRGEQDVRASRDMRDSSAAQIVALAKALGSRMNDGNFLMDVMRQRGKAQPPAKLAEIADSLTVLAIKGGSSRRYLDYLTALVSAGDETLAGVTYAGTLDRLIRIHREGSGDAQRASLLPMLDMPQREQAFAYLRSVATSNDLSSMTAVTVLMSHTEVQTIRGPVPPDVRVKAEAMLKELWTRMLVQYEDSRLMLNSFAVRKGWAGRGGSTDYFSREARRIGTEARCLGCRNESRIRGANATLPRGLR